MVGTCVTQTTVRNSCSRAHESYLSGRGLGDEPVNHHQSMNVPFSSQTTHIHPDGFCRRRDEMERCAYGYHVFDAHNDDKHLSPSKHLEVRLVGNYHFFSYSWASKLHV